MLAACGGNTPDDGPSGPSKGELSVLTYNVHGLPDQITGDEGIPRMTGINPLLDRFDLIGLQEDFLDENHEILVDGLDHETLVWFDEVVGDAQLGSGLAALARYPVSDEHLEHFDACHGYVDAASDCLASKGFQILRVKLGPGATVDWYNTHHEAGGSEEDNVARLIGVNQIVAQMQTFSAGNAILFTADTNLKWSDPEDLEALNLLYGNDLLDTCVETGCPDDDHIDRILFRSGGGVTLEAKSWTEEPDFFDDAGVPLSDHPAISSVIAWSKD